MGEDRTGQQRPPDPPCGADGGDVRVTEKGVTEPPRPAAILVGRTQWCCGVVGRRRDVIGRRPSLLRKRWRRRPRARGRRPRNGGGCSAQ